MLQVSDIKINNGPLYIYVRMKTDPSKRGIPLVTIGIEAVTLDGKTINEYIIGWSTCSLKDQFNKELGRDIVANRIEKLNQLTRENMRRQSKHAFTVGANYINEFLEGIEKLSKKINQDFTGQDSNSRYYKPKYYSKRSCKRFIDNFMKDFAESERRKSAVV